MDITKTIKLEVKKTMNSIICGDLTTLSLVLGTKSISGNLNLYKVQKTKDGYVVPVSFVRQRIEVLEKRRNSLNESLDIMRQVVK